MTLTFDAPGPGPWQQDQAHMPHGMTRVVTDLYVPNAQKGFTETFGRWGALLDTLAWGVVNGFVYHQPQPFDLPGPDGPPSPDFIGSEIERRTGIAAAAFENKIWREILQRWDEELKPAAVRRHRELFAVDLGSLDDAALTAHVAACMSLVEDMAYQHHRFNASALIPPSDFALHCARWLDEDPASFFGVLDGYSPASGVVSPELAPAVAALGDDAEARALLDGPGEAGERLEALRRRVPEVEEFVMSTGARLVEGFDVTSLTASECPEVILGRLAAGLDTDPTEARRRADAFAASVRERVPEEHRDLYDELLGEARLMYRLRDERGLYSDIPAFGLLRLALLEAGRRLVARGALVEPEHLFELDRAEVEDLLAGTSELSAAEIADRFRENVAIRAGRAPRFLGPPPPEPPPLDQLPPPLARVMAAVGFAIEGILGQLEEEAGDETCVVGIPGSPGVYEGNVHLVSNMDDLMALDDGDVLVSATTGEAFNSMLHLVGAIVTDHGSFSCHAAIVARESGFPAVVGTTNATSRLSEGQRVRVDGGAGTVTVLT